MCPKKFKLSELSGRAWITLIACSETQLHSQTIVKTMLWKGSRVSELVFQQGYCYKWPATNGCSQDALVQNLVVLAHHLDLPPFCETFYREFEAFSRFSILHFSYKLLHMRNDKYKTVALCRSMIGPIQTNVYSKSKVFKLPGRAQITLLTSSETQLHSMNIVKTMISK